MTAFHGALPLRSRSTLYRVLQLSTVITHVILQYFRISTSFAQIPPDIWAVLPGVLPLGNSTVAPLKAQNYTKMSSIVIQDLEGFANLLFVFRADVDETCTGISRNSLKFLTCCMFMPCS